MIAPSTTPTTTPTARPAAARISVSPRIGRVPDAHQPVKTKAAMLRALIESPETEFLLEAHNGISARIAEEAGVKGIWASGLTISAQFGVRDNNEASWTQVADMLEFMSDATSVPILVDGDTGYGNFNNARRLVRKLEQRRIAGVCIEDKVFPKTNSFIGGGRQPLAEIAEFSGKVRAAKDSQEDKDFCVVARVEALIAGWGMSEALRRAEAYQRAGADAILIHSAKRHPDEILAFAEKWGAGRGSGGRCPLVIVPTKYYSTPPEVFRQAGISVVIWANHLLRAAVTAMRSVAEELSRTRVMISVEERVATVDEVFRLQGADELLEAERCYGGEASAMEAVVLAASRGAELGAMTERVPKVMIPVGGRPLLEGLVAEFKRAGVGEITVVAGYKPEAIDVAGVTIVRNDRYEHSGELASLVCALDRRRAARDGAAGPGAPEAGGLVVCYGDLLFRRYILRDLLDAPGPMAVTVDSAPDAGAAPGACPRDAAWCSTPDDRSLFVRDVRLRRVAPKPNGVRPAPGAGAEGDRAPEGRWIGMLRVDAEGMPALEEAIAELRNRADFDRLDLPDLLNHLIERERIINVVYIHGNWLDVNNVRDLAEARDFAHSAGAGGGGGAGVARS